MKNKILIWIRAVLNLYTLPILIQQILIPQQVNEQSFRDLYDSKMANPVFYSAPRRIRLGVQLNFIIRHYLKK